MHAPRLLVIQHNLDAHLSELGGPLADAGLTIEPWFTYSRHAPLLDVSEYERGALARSDRRPQGRGRSCRPDLG